MQPFLNPLVNALVLVERLWLMDNEHAINLIRFGLRALENALDTARNANTECSLHNDPKLVHFLSWCMRYRHNAKTRDIPVSALNCMRHFALTLFLEEIFVTDIPRILKEERQLGVDAQLFLTSWCSTLACMIENNGISDQMMTRTVSRMANGLFMLTGEKWRCSDRGLRRSACHALTVLGCSLRGGPYMDAFWVAGGGNGLLVALSLDMEAAVNHQALLALKNLLPAIPAEASKFLVFQPKLRGDLKEAAEKYLYSQDDATSQVADAVMKKLDILEDAENEMSNLAHQSNNLKADQAPATKRRRVELGAFNS